MATTKPSEPLSHHTRLEGAASKESVSFEDTLSFHQASEQLKARLGASDFEFWQWIQDGRIHLYGKLADGRYAVLDRERTGIELSLPDDPDTERHLRGEIRFRRFLSTEIDGFNPSKGEYLPESDSELEDYPYFQWAGFVDSLASPSDTNSWAFNPSGRFVSFEDSVEFLRKLADEGKVAQHLRLEVDRGRIQAYGYDDESPELEKSFLCESQIVALATVCYGRSFDGWDAISRTSGAEIGKEAPKYIPYPRALASLRDRLKATPAEVAAWVWFGPEEGGLRAYLNANEFTEPPRFCFSSPDCDGADYLEELARAWFCRDEIAGFEPTDRYVTGAELRDRWSQSVTRLGISVDAYVRGKIEESRLLDAHPIMGLTQLSVDRPWSPPRESALFVLAHVELIEKEDGIEPYALDLRVSEGAIEPCPKPTDAAMTSDATSGDDEEGMEPAAQIIRYKKPIRIKDDWTEVLIAVIEEHEQQHGETGTETQIWSRIGERPSQGYCYAWDKQQNAYNMFGNPPLSRERFSERFNRLYPNAKPGKAR